jgi:hypothetical protein
VVYRDVPADPSTYAGRPVQWSDFSPSGQRVFNAQMRQAGRTKANIPAIADKMDATAARAQASIDNPLSTDKKRASAAKTLVKAESSKANLQAIKKQLRNPVVTLDAAAQRRTNLTRDSASRALREAPEGLGGGSRLRAAGAGWYFDHRSALNATAAQYGIDEDRIVTASAVMSPQNSPDNEKAAASSLAALHSSNPELTLSKAAMKELGIDSPSVKYSTLTPSQASRLGKPELREHITGVDASVLEGLAKGGTHENVELAINVLRGNVKTDDAINPHTAAKVWGYRDSIRQSVPGTDAHQEYLARADNAMFQIPGQQRLDLHGLKDSTEGPLNPNKPTAEDTWQGAISSGQPLESIPVKGSIHKVSPAKFVASDKSITSGVTKTGMVDGKRVSAFPDSEIPSTSLVHAWHNEATIRSAKQLSQSSGEIIPSTLPQEVGWTEARRVADKDPAYLKLNASQFDDKRQSPNQLSFDL